MAAPAMDELADRHGDRGVTSVFVYTREAHPGEHYRHHTSMEGKRENARALVEHCDLRRRILLDDLQGTVHRAYGLLPNMTWIVGLGGRVLYKATWTDPDDVESALRRALDAAERRREKLKQLPFYSERLVYRSRDDDAFRAGLVRNGPQAVSDFYGPQS